MDSDDVRSGTCGTCLDSHVMSQTNTLELYTESECEVCLTDVRGKVFAHGAIDVLRV